MRAVYADSSADIYRPWPTAGVAVVAAAPCAGKVTRRAGECMHGEAAMAREAAACLRSCIVPDRVREFVGREGISV